MALTLQRAKEIKRIFLDDIEKTHTIPGHIVGGFWEFYSQEFRPGQFAQMPCTCSPKTWIDMVNSVKNEVNEALATEVVETPVTLSEALVEEPKKKTVKSKKTAAVIEEDKPTEDETIAE